MHFSPNQRRSKNSYPTSLVRRVVDNHTVVVTAQTKLMRDDFITQSAIEPDISKCLPVCREERFESVDLCHSLVQTIEKTGKTNIHPYVNDNPRFVWPGFEVVSTSTKDLPKNIYVFCNCNFKIQSGNLNHNHFILQPECRARAVTEFNHSVVHWKNE